MRADIVYFRQDFSATHPVAAPGRWPAEQRFDYLVRKRELTAKEIEKVVLPPGEERARGSYPQREAVREALAALGRRKGEKGEAK